MHMRQNRKLDELLTLVYLPAGQSIQYCWLPNEYFPGRQPVQVVALIPTELKPGAQSMQAEDRSLEYCPGTQSLQTDEGPGEAFPPTHHTQVVEELEFALRCPGRH